MRIVSARELFSVAARRNGADSICKRKDRVSAKARWISAAWVQRGGMAFLWRITVVLRDFSALHTRESCIGGAARIGLQRTADARPGWG